IHTHTSQSQHINALETQTLESAKSVPHFSTTHTALRHKSVSHFTTTHTHHSETQECVTHTHTNTQTHTQTHTHADARARQDLCIFSTHTQASYASYTGHIHLLYIHKDKAF